MKQQIEKKFPVGIVPMISYSDGTIGKIEEFLEKMQPEITSLRDKALKTYRREIDETIGVIEKELKKWPEPYRTEILKAGQVFFQIVFSCQFAKDQQIAPESDIAFALQLLITEHSTVFHDLFAQSSAELSRGKFSKEKVLNILDIAAISAELRPLKITKTKIEVQRGGRNPKTPLAAEIKLHTKHVKAVSRPVLEILLPQKRTGKTGRHSEYEEQAEYFAKLALSGKYRSKESMFDEVCKQFVPGYASLDYKNHLAKSERRLVDSGIREILRKYENAAETFSKLKSSDKLPKKSLLDKTCKRHPNLARNYASLSRDSAEAKSIRKRFDLLIQCILNEVE